MRLTTLCVALAAIITVLAAQPVSAQSCSGSAQEINGREVNLVRMDAIDGVSLLGTYENEGVERPHVILNEGGTGIYEMHAQRLDDGIPVPMEWFVVANCDGSAFESGRGDRGVAYALAVRYGDSQLAAQHPPGSWGMYSLFILPGERTVVINGDRVRKY